MIRSLDDFGFASSLGLTAPQILRDDIINPLGLTPTTIDAEVPDAPDLLKG